MPPSFEGRPLNGLERFFRSVHADYDRLVAMTQPPYPPQRPVAVLVPASSA
jgi:hypothetical protein